jgi:hypothetical protein
LCRPEAAAAMKCSVVRVSLDVCSITRESLKQNSYEKDYIQSTCKTHVFLDANCCEICTQFIGSNHMRVRALMRTHHSQFSVPPV